MLQRFIPKRMAYIINSQIMKIITNPYFSVHSLPFFPYQRTKNSYTIPNIKTTNKYSLETALPIPPSHLWNDKTHTLEQYLSIGKEHFDTMRQTVEQTGFALDKARRILDFGCGSGRLIRHLSHLSQQQEIWGVDISSEHIYWLMHHLSPPFHFATTTTTPHLPFEDQSFDLIYARSVFTHIDDLAKTWLLELHRILRRGGRLYVTIHDRRSIDILNDKDRQLWLTKFISSYNEYERYISSDFGMFTLGRATASQVFYDINYFRKLAEPMYKVISVVDEAHGFQTGVLMSRA